MKKSALVLSLVFATSGLALAQDTVKEAPKAPAKHASKHLAAKHEVAGEVVSIDAEKKTVTFTNEKGESLTWPAEGKALASLKSVKAGDKVTIHYAVDAKGAPKSATEITSAPVAQVKPATPVKNATAATTAKSDAPKTEAPKAEAPKPNDKK
jgi:Cu/Ag efflux protein CusF